MEKIKLDGKLKLNKETIAKLNDDQMNGVKGGLLSITANCSHPTGTCPYNGKKVSKGLFCG